MPWHRVTRLIEQEDVTALGADRPLLQVPFVTAFILPHPLQVGDVPELQGIHLGQAAGEQRHQPGFRQPVTNPPVFG